MPPKILDATFVTRHPPDIDRNAFIVGICAVPSGREGNDNLGCHVADFLAWKLMYATRSASKDNQIWLSQIDLNDAIQKHSYVHTGRDVSGAATDIRHTIVVEPNVQALVGRFMKAVMQKSEQTRDHDDQLVIIACGLTSLEQDIFMIDGNDYAAIITSESIHAALDKNIKVIFVSPSVTSAGWQVNPSFMQPVTTEAGAIEFMARQCGAVFSHIIIRPFYNHGSPFLDKDSTMFVPVVKSDKLKGIEAKLHEEIYAQMAGRFVSQYSDHSFTFDSNIDPWKLVAVRKGIALTKLAEQWASNLTEVKMPESGDCFRFLGSAFGGNQKSQLIHIAHMFKQSLGSAGYRSSNLKRVQEHFDALRAAAEHDEIDFQILFNALEHRMSFIALADMVTKGFGLSYSFTTRCRDWNEAGWTDVAKDLNVKLIDKIWGKIISCIPSIGMPYDRNVDIPTGLFVLLRGPSRYIATALVMRYPEAGHQLDEAVNDICNVLRQIAAYQFKLICASTKVRELGIAWAERSQFEDTTEKEKGQFRKGARLLTDSRIPLSAQAKVFVPGVQYIPTTRVTIQPHSPTRDNMTPEATSMMPTTKKLVQSKDEESFQEVNATSDKSNSKTIDIVQSRIIPDASAMITNPITIAHSCSSQDHSEEHLPPHLRTRLHTPVHTPTLVPPYGAAKQAPKTEDPRPVPRSTPPHLRISKTPASVSSLKYR